MVKNEYNTDCFFVMLFDCNRKEVYKFDVIPHFVSEYKRLVNLHASFPEPERDLITPDASFEEWREWVTQKSMVQFWGRCQYEILVNDWPLPKNDEDLWKKIDVHYQLMMNINIVTNIVMRKVREEFK